MVAAGGGCERLFLLNSSQTHVHVLRAELYTGHGRLVWSSAGGAYALARSQRELEPQLCEPAAEGDLELKVTSDRGSLDVPRTASPSGS
jgi:hypothetical protein